MNIIFGLASPKFARETTESWFFFVFADGEMADKQAHSFSFKLRHASMSELRGRNDYL